MTLRSYLWGLRLSTLFIFVVWLGVILFTDPIELGVLAYILFYLTFFFWITGCAILALTWLWRRMAADAVTAVELGVSFRQGILIGCLVTLIVVMQQFRVLVWWDAILVTAAVLLIELHFLTRQKV